MTACTGRFSLTADYGERTFECVLDATYDQVTGGTLTIAEPELVKGVTARFSAEGTALTYEGFSLETGPLTDEGISPMETLPTLWKQISGGYMAAVEERDGSLTVTYRADGQSPGTGLEAVVVFDAESGGPTSGAALQPGAGMPVRGRGQGQRLRSRSDPGGEKAGGAGGGISGGGLSGRGH